MLIMYAGFITRTFEDVGVNVTSGLLTVKADVAESSSSILKRESPSISMVVAVPIAPLPTSFRSAEIPARAFLVVIPAGLTNGEIFPKRLS
jgi:hypothetical protein